MRQQPKLWDSQREREEKRENFPAKVSNLALSQNKGLSQYQRRASLLRTVFSRPLEAERQVRNSQNWKARGNLSPREGNPPPNFE